MPVFYGEYHLYTPVVGAPREYLETRCTISINSNVLIRVPFQASTSNSSSRNFRVGEIITPDNPLFDPVRAKEEVECVYGAVSDSHSKGYENKYEWRGC